MQTLDRTPLPFDAGVVVPVNAAVAAFISSSCCLESNSEGSNVRKKSTFGFNFLRFKYSNVCFCKSFHLGGGGGGG